MLSLIFLPLILFSFINLVSDLKNKKNSLGLHCLNITYLYIYGLGGLYSVFNYPDYQWLYSNFDREDYYYFLTAILVSLAYFLSYKSYFIFSSFSFKGSSGISLKLISYSSNIALFLCLIFIYVYISQYGGLIRALESAAAIRSGYGELEDGAKLTFVKYLMPIGVFPFLLYGYKVAIKPSVYNVLMWFFSFSLVFLAFLLMSGRTRIVIYLLAMIVVFIYAKKNVRINLNQFIKFSPIIFVAIFFAMYGKIIFSSLGEIISGDHIGSIIESSEKKESFLASMLGYFCHRTYSIEAALINFRETNELYWFKDNFMSMFYLIPERLTGIVKPDSISPYSTEILTGVYEGTIPPGILAYGIYSMWIPGLFIMAMVYSFVFAIVDSYFRSNFSKKYLLIILLPIIVVWGLYGSTGDFKIIVNSFSYILVFLLIILILKTLAWISRR